MIKRKKEPYYYYCSGTDTIRQAPQSMLIAHRKMHRWIMDFDVAVNYELLQLFLYVRKNYHTFNMDGLEFTALLNTKLKAMRQKIYAMYVCAVLVFLMGVLFAFMYSIYWLIACPCAMFFIIGAITNEYRYKL